MSLTRVTGSVIGANVVSADKLANASIVSRHLAEQSIDIQHLSANVNTITLALTAAANDFATFSTLNTRINNVQANLYSDQAVLAANIFTALTNENSIQSNVYTLTTSVNTIQANVNSVQSNVVTLTSTAAANDFVTYTRLNANLNLVQGNVTTLTATAAANDFATYSRLNANINLTQSNVTTLTTSVNTIRGNVSAVQSNVNTVQSNLSSLINSSTPFTVDKVFQQNVTIQGNLIVLGSQVDLSVTSAAVVDAIILLSSNLSSDTPPPGDGGMLINRGSYTNVFIGMDSTVGNHIDFVYTDSPGDALTISTISYVDLHANAFHAAGGSLASLPFALSSDKNTGLFFPTTDTLSFVTGGIMRANVTASGNLQIMSGIVQGPGALPNSINLDDDVLSDRADAVSIRSLSSLAVFLDYDNNGTADYFGIYADTDSPATATKEAALFSVRDTGDTVTLRDANITRNANIQNAVSAATVFSSGVELRANDYATYNTLNTSINTVQSNVATLTTSVNTIRANVNAVQSNVTTLTTSVNTIRANINAVQSNVATLTSTTAANDFITYTRLNANLNSIHSNVVATQSNVNLVQDNVTAITGGGTLLKYFVNVNSSTGTSNVFFLGRDITNQSNIVSVAISGLAQAFTVDYVPNFSNNTIQFVDQSIPAGLIILTSVLTTV